MVALTRHAARCAALQHTDSVVTSLAEHVGVPWMVLEDVVAVDAGELDGIRRMAASRDATRVFNPDQKRTQICLPPDHTACDQLRRAASSLCFGRSARDAVALLSRAGCVRQQWHCDYDPRCVGAATIKPIGLLVALEDAGAHMHILHDGLEHVVTLSRGQILAFDGDTVHAGGGYECDNARMHMYLDSVDVSRPHNKTYLVTKHIKR